MNSNTKRRNKTNSNRLPRSKTSVDKNIIEGVYCNARFMHAAASLVGCLVDVLTNNGTLYEGIFHCFSSQFEIVLNLAHIKNRTHCNLPTKDAIFEVLIINFSDVVNLTAKNTDLEYATKEQFSTDTAISKYNGQIVERELEPWDETPGEVEDVTSSSLDDNEVKNGWDVNDMFRTNEQQYGVQSTYDNTLSGYTTPLERKNTDEYKKQEAKASKIASEIENSPTYLARIAVENGDEEDKFSAVVRPENVGNTNAYHRYVPPAKRKSAQSGKLPRMSPAQNASNNTPSGLKSHPPPQGHGPQQHQSHGPRMQPPGAHPPQTHYGPPQQPSSMGGVPTIPHHPQTPQSHQTPIPQPQQLPPVAKMPPQNVENDVKINGEKMEKDEKKGVLRNENPAGDFRENDQGKKMPAVPEQLPPIHISNKPDRKNLNPKPHDDQIAEFKKFSSDFKLEETEENECNKPEVIDAKEKIETEADKAANVLKTSTLNPNAKEFVLNPNAKTFTPRSPSTQTPTPPRPHTPSTTVLTQPMTAIMATQPMFTGLQPSYMMPGPVVSLNSPYNPAASMQQAPRMRKAVPPSMHQQRHEFSQVAAATGQPLLAPASIPGHPHHLTVQYGSPHQGIIANHGQPTLPYHQVYPVLGPRMVGPQHISMVSTSHGASYGDNQHIFVSAHPTGLAAAMSGQNPHAHAASQISALSSGQAHSTSSNQQGPPMPGQAQGGGVHPNPSPVHQPPPHGGPPPTQTPPATVGTPQPMVYQPPHPSQMGQPPPSLQPTSHTPNSPQTMHPGGQGAGPPSHNHHMPHHNAVSHAPNASHGGPHMAQNPHSQHQVGGSGGPAGYPQGPQSLVLIHQQGHGHPQAGHTFQGPMHGPGPTVLMPHSSMPVSVMPATSGAATMSTHPQLYIPHHAASQPQLQPYAHAQ